MSKIFLLLFLFCFSQSIFALDNPEARVSAVIKDYVVATYPDLSKDELKVTFKYAERIFANLAKCSEGTTFQVADVYRDFRPVGSAIFPLMVTDGDQNNKIFIRTQVEVLKEVVVAGAPIKRGVLIKIDDLAIQQRDVALYPKKYFTSVLAVASCEAKTLIAQNSTIFDWMIKEVPLRHRGDEVKIIVIGENIQVKTKGIILTDGYLNQEVKVRRKGTNDAKNILTGKLISENEVEVTLP
jgi:flagella basal body P-ring formation protein FlgA